MFIFLNRLYIDISVKHFNFDSVILSLFRISSYLLISLDVCVFLHRFCFHFLCLLPVSTEFTFICMKSTEEFRMWNLLIFISAGNTKHIRCVMMIFSYECL